MADTAVIKKAKQLNRGNKKLAKVIRRAITNNKTTTCAMDETLYFKGAKCPVTNCYMNCPDTGKCLASQSEPKVSAKAMRDTLTIIAIIDKAKEVPKWADSTKITYLRRPEYQDFIREANLNPAKLQFVLDQSMNNESVFKSLFMENSDA